MYLEISARQTGKTTRMIEAINQHIAAAGDVAVFVHDKHWGLRIKEHFDGCIQQRVVTFTCAADFYDWERGQSLNNLKVFYDEFEMMDYRDCIIDSDGYYCTTAINMRTFDDIILHRLGKKEDFLLDLLDLCGGGHMSYGVCNMISKQTIKNLCEMRMMYDENQWNTEFNGHWATR